MVFLFHRIFDVRLRRQFNATHNVWREQCEQNFGINTFLFSFVFIFVLFSFLIWSKSFYQYTLVCAQCASERRLPSRWLLFSFLFLSSISVHIFSSLLSLITLLLNFRPGVRFSPLTHQCPLCKSQVLNVQFDTKAGSKVNSHLFVLLCLWGFFQKKI